MRVTLPRIGQHVNMPDRHMAPDWYQFFRTFTESLGWNRNRAIWTHLAPSHAVFDGTTHQALLTTMSVPAFDGGSTESLSGAFLLPNTYFEGSDLYPFLVSAAPSGTTGNAVVQLQIASGSPLSIGYDEEETISLAGSLTPVNTEFDALSGSNFARGQVLPFTLSRLGGGAGDTSTSDMYLCAFGLSYRVQGSGQEKRFP